MPQLLQQLCGKVTENQLLNYEKSLLSLLHKTFLHHFYVYLTCRNKRIFLRAFSPRKISHYNIISVVEHSRNLRHYKVRCEIPHLRRDKTTYCKIGYSRCELYGLTPRLSASFVPPAAAGMHRRNDTFFYLESLEESEKTLRAHVHLVSLIFQRALSDAPAMHSPSPQHAITFYASDVRRLYHRERDATLQEISVVHR